MGANITRFIRLTLVCLVATFVTSVCADDVQQRHILPRVPEAVEPGLSDVLFSKGICQNDFDDGTFRITKPGSYHLKEDIIFAPNQLAELKRKDKPEAGWFAAISIEADNVSLDLNTKTIQAECAIQQNFCIIALNNAPFSRRSTLYHRTSYKNNKKYIAANNVIIRNGMLSKSPGCGIHGIGNRNIQLYDLVISDFMHTGISLKDVLGGQIKHSCILRSSVCDHSENNQGNVIGIDLRGVQENVHCIEIEGVAIYFRE